MSPKVSVIVPVYNVEKYLVECLDSALNQSLEDIEIICVNDGSTDGSLEILRSYERKDPRIHVIDKENGGYGIAMNRGLDVAQGEYIGILESDDYVAPNSWEMLYSTAKKYDLDVVKANYYRATSKSNSFFEVCRNVDPNCPDNFSIVPYDTCLRPLEYPRCFWMNPSIWSGIYKRSYLHENDIRFNETPGASYQDTSFAFKVWLTSKRAMFLKPPVLHYRVDNENSSTSSKAKVFAVCDEMKECESYIRGHGLGSAAQFILCAIRYKTYEWNIARIDKAFLPSFLLRAVKDYRHDIRSGWFSEEFFAKDSAMRFFQIAGLGFGPVRDSFSACKMVQKSTVDDPCVSVIVPVFNQAKYVQECVDSILGQSLSQIELILVDDGSTDGSFDLEKEAADHDGRVTLLRQSNSGQSCARNNALKVARGRYCCFVDSDDLIDENALEVCYRRANSDSLDVVLFDARSIYESEDLRKRYPQYETQYSRKHEYGDVRSGMYLFSEMEVGRDYQVSPCLALVSREHICKQGLRFKEGIIHEDNLWTFQLLLSARRAVHIRQPFYIRRVRDGSTMTGSSAVKRIIGYVKCLSEMSRYLSSGDFPYPVRKSAHNQLGIIEKEIIKLFPGLAINDRLLVESSISENEQELLRLAIVNNSGESTNASQQRQLSQLRHAYNRMRQSNAAKIGRAVTYTPKKIVSIVNRVKRISKRGGGSIEVNSKDKILAKHPKVLLVAGDARYSGASMSLAVMARDLRDMGEDIRVALPSNGPLEGILREFGIPYIVVKSWQWAISIDADNAELSKQRRHREAINNKAILALVDYIKTNGIQLVHTNTIGTYVGAVAAQRAGVRSVWHIREFMEEDHGVKFWDDNEAFDLLKQSDLCICISKSVQEKYASKIGREKCYLIYNGIDVNKFLCYKEPFGSSTIEITVCANFEPGKGQIEAVQALGMLKERCPMSRFHLNLVGQHFKREYVQEVNAAIRQYGLEQVVYLPGVRDDMDEFWAHTDIAIVPSRAEAFGRCTVEAMMSGCFVIGSNSAGTAELIEDGVTGFLYEKGNPDSLMEKLAVAMNETDLVRDMVAAARQYARIQFPSERNSREVYEAHCRILGASL